MPALAATATENPLDYAPLVILAAILTLSYLAWCAVMPFASCQGCAGQGKIRTPRRALACLRCDGHGIRLRLGRRFINHLIELHRAAHRPDRNRR